MILLFNKIRLKIKCLFILSLVKFKDAYYIIIILLFSFSELKYVY